VKKKTRNKSLSLSEPLPSGFRVAFALIPSRLAHAMLQADNIRGFDLEALL